MFCLNARNIIGFPTRARPLCDDENGALHKGLAIHGITFDLPTSHYMLQMLYITKLKNFIKVNDTQFNR